MRFMLAEISNKSLFDYWYDQVRLKNHELIASSEHVTTPRLRHECTNYDQLRNRKELDNLDEFERSRIVTIIKYECTSQVLQRRAGLLKDRAKQLDEICRDQELRYSRLKGLILVLQQKLFGKDQKIRRLELRIQQLEMVNEVLDAEQQTSQAELEMQRELDELQNRLEAAEGKRWELTRRTRSLGGRLAHTLRYKRERDELRVQLLAVQARNQELAERLNNIQPSVSSAYAPHGSTEL
jgi:hypothetical protein